MGEMMVDEYLTETPILETPLGAGEGTLINIVADFAKEFRRSETKEDWKPLVEYLNSDEISPVAKQLGLYLLREIPEEEVSPNIKAVADWYEKATENEKRLEKVLFRSEYTDGSR